MHISRWNSPPCKIFTKSEILKAESKYVYVCIYPIAPKSLHFQTEVFFTICTTMVNTRGNVTSTPNPVNYEPNRTENPRVYFRCCVVLFIFAHLRHDYSMYFQMRRLLFNLKSCNWGMPKPESPTWGTTLFIQVSSYCNRRPAGGRAAIHGETCYYSIATMRNDTIQIHLLRQATIPKIHPMRHDTIHQIHQMRHATIQTHI